MERTSKHWLQRIAEQFEQRQPMFAQAQKSSTGKRIVLFSVVPWHNGVVEHLISASLGLKGVQVLTIICGGDFPACSMESVAVQRPACDECLVKAQRYVDAFGLAYQTTRDWISPEDFARAEAMVQELNRGALVEMTYLSVPVGRNSFRDLCQYCHYPMREITDEVEPLMRRFLVSSIVNVDLAQRVHARMSPDSVIISNGKAIAYASIYSYMLSRGVDIVTWDESPVFRNGFTFNRNVYASEIHLKGIWPQVCDISLTPVQQKLVDSYFEQWRAGRNARYQYHEGSIEDSPELQAIAEAASGRKIISMYSNLTWETSHLDRNVGFDHLLEAIFFLIDYVSRRDNYYLVVRAHPAEYKVPEEIRTIVPLQDIIRRRYPRLPSNVTVLPGNVSVNSYSLADISQVLCVYTSTIGLEMALTGRAVLVLGDCHYRSKGFTVDITSPEMLDSYLDSLQDRSLLRFEQIDLARRYVYLWVFRHIVRIPYLDQQSRSRYHIDSIEDILPGSDSVIDRLTDRILSGEEFLDVGCNT